MSVFTASGESLELTDRVASGGSAPRSVAVHGDRVYVLNTGGEPSVAGFVLEGRTVFVTNFGDGTISTYAIGDDGRIKLREAVAATTVEGTPGIRDEALSSDGEYLYALHADTGRVFGWRVGAGGELAALGSANGLPLTAAGLAAS